MGVRAIKEAGGVIFVQDPLEAEYPMMPRNAISTGVADFVARIPQLVERLGEVARNKDAIRSLSEDGVANELRRIVNFMRVRTGHDFSNYKRATVMRRVARRMQVARCESMATYAEYVRETPEEAQELFADLLISVTMFFRDHNAFEVLAQQAIAPIVNDMGGGGRSRLGRGLRHRRGSLQPRHAVSRGSRAAQSQLPLQIFATDLDEGALATAREARYPRSIEADVSEERLRRWFVDEGTHYRIRQEVRELVLFATHSVLKDPPFMRLDLITCRNLLIYLERSVQRQLGTLFHYGLKPNRFLFLGSAESADVTPDLFIPVDRESRLYRARPQAVRVLPQLPSAVDDQRGAPLERRRSLSREEQEKNATFMHMAALERDSPPSILLDEAQRILNMSPSAGRYILHSGGPFTAELPAIVRPELRLDLKMALERAFQTREPTADAPGRRRLRWRKAPNSFACSADWRRR